MEKRIADYIGGYAVITTASDVQGKVALDLWAEERNLFVEDSKKLKKLCFFTGASFCNLSRVPTLRKIAKWGPRKMGTH